MRDIDTVIIRGRLFVIDKCVLRTQGCSGAVDRSNKPALNTTIDTKEQNYTRETI
jgi:hypothetical protein